MQLVCFTENIVIKRLLENVLDIYWNYFLTSIVFSLLEVCTTFLVLVKVLDKMVVFYIVHVAGKSILFRASG